MPYLYIRQPNIQITADLPAYFACKTKQERIAFSVMIDCSNRFKDIQPSRQRIATSAGVTVRTIDRWKREWKFNGLLESQHRKSHMKNRSRTNKYALHPSFYRTSVRESLSVLHEFSLVFKCIPIPREIVKPGYGRTRYNIKVLLSVTKQPIQETINLAKENYVSPIKSIALLGISKQLNSAGFEGPETCQVESPEKARELPGYDPNMTVEQKKAYALARSAAIAFEKKEQAEQQTTPIQQTVQKQNYLEIPDWVRRLSSYEQGLWCKENLSSKGRVILEKNSRESRVGNVRYQEELYGFVERERRASVRKRDSFYH